MYIYIVKKVFSQRHTQAILILVMNADGVEIKSKKHIAKEYNRKMLTVRTKEGPELANARNLCEINSNQS